MPSALPPHAFSSIQPDMILMIDLDPNCFWNDVSSKAYPQGVSTCWLLLLYSMNGFENDISCRKSPIYIFKNYQSPSIT